MESHRGLEPFRNQESSPFRGEMTPILPYDRMTMSYIMELEASPNKVVRVSPRNNEGREDADKWLKHLEGQLATGDSLLGELTEKYGIAVVSHDHVIAGSPENPDRVTAYTVADRVFGDTLRAEFGKKPPEVSLFDIEGLYSGLIRYYTNVLKNGGSYLSDVSRNNSQYMYGCTASDPTQRIYLTDIDPLIWRYTPGIDTEGQPRDLHRSIGALAGCITSAEAQAGWDLSHLKADYLQALDVIPEESQYRFYVDKLIDTQVK